MSHALELSVPIQPDKDGKVNAILVYVDYDKARGGIYLGMMGINIDDQVMSFVMFDPIHKAKYVVLEPLTRLNARKLDAHCAAVSRSIDKREDIPWGDICDFAAEMGFTILDPVEVEITV